MPPATTMMKAFRITSLPTVGYTATIGASRLPATAARAALAIKARV
jgi:hypothetical protein